MKIKVYTYGGCTNLSRGVGLLKNVIDEHGNVSVCVVTDGSIDDYSESVRMLNQIETEIVSCLGIRYGNLGNTDIIAQFSIKTPEKTCDIRTLQVMNLIDILNEKSHKYKIVSDNKMYIYPGDVSTNELFVSSKTLFLLDEYDGEMKDMKVDVLEQYLHQLLNYIKTLTILNTSYNIDQIRNFVDSAEVYFNKLTADSANMRLFMLQKLKKKNRSVINDIRSVLNAKHINTLRTQQEKADWLSGKDSNKTLRRKEKNETNLEDMLKKIQELKLVDESDVCYINQLSTKENLDNLGNLRDVYIDNVSLNELLALVGVVGVPVSLTVSDYVDPWKVRVLKCYWGLRINQNEFYGNKLTSLDVPGYPGEKFNAVVPFGDNIKAFRSTGMLNEHAGLFMRQTLGSIPGDELALTVATIMHLLTENSSGSQLVLDKLIQSLNYSYFKNMDIDEISDISMLVGKYLLLGATQLEFEFLWVMFLYFKSKHKIWDTEMKYVLDYSDNKVVFNPTLFTRDVKQSSKFNKKLANERLLELKLFDDADITFFQALSRKLNLKFTLDIEFKVDPKTIWWGISSNNRKSLEENLSKHPYELMYRFLRQVKTQHYQKLTFEKKKLEDVCILKSQYRTMLECSYDRFIELLNGQSYVNTEYGPKPPVKYIGTSNSIYNNLIDNLQNKQKIWALTTGRDETGCIVWNNGNIITLEDNILEKLTQLNLVDDFKEFKNKYGMINYRPGKRNRHDHGNDNPSYYSLSGGTCHDKDSYFKTINSDKQQEYNKRHKGCCGN